MPISKQDAINTASTVTARAIDEVCAKIDAKIKNDYIPDERLVIEVDSLSPGIVVLIRKLYSDQGWRVEYEESIYGGEAFFTLQ